MLTTCARVKHLAQALLKVKKTIRFGLMTFAMNTLRYQAARGCNQSLEMATPCQRDLLRSLRSLVGDSVQSSLHINHVVAHESQTLEQVMNVLSASSCIYTWQQIVTHLDSNTTEQHFDRVDPGWRCRCIFVCIICPVLAVQGRSISCEAVGSLSLVASSCTILHDVRLVLY